MFSPVPVLSLLIVSLLVFFYIKHKKNTPLTALINAPKRKRQDIISERESNEIDKVDNKDVDEILTEDSKEAKATEKCFAELASSKKEYEAKKKELDLKLLELSKTRKSIKQKCEDEKAKYDIKKLDEELLKVKRRIGQ